MSKSTSNKFRAGFTLVELVVVVLILGIIAAVVTPKLFNSANDAAIVATAAKVKVIFDAANRHFAETGSYPSDVTPGIFPPEFANKLQPNIFETKAPMKGEFDWNGPETTLEAIGVSISVRSVTPETLSNWQKMDYQFDDGNLATGLVFRSTRMSKHLIFKLADK